MAKILNNYMLYVKGEKNNFILNMIFTPMSWLVNFAIYISDFLYRHGILKIEEPPLPVISVGNLTYGGTNKTPFVEMLAKFSASKGIKTGIVTRGYSGKSNNVIIIKNGNGERNLTGDEPLLLSRELPEIPVAIAKKRIEGVKALKNLGVELVIADDAFQHRNMNRDCDIVLIDSLCPFGNDKLIPAGMMREKVYAISRADIVVLTKSEYAKPEELEKLRKILSEYINPDKIFTSELEHQNWILFANDKINLSVKQVRHLPLERGDSASPFYGEVAHKVRRRGKTAKLFAFSAIGSPESFIRTLTEHGLEITGQKNFRDHHNYSHKDLENLYNLAKKKNSDFMTCTEKDLYNFPKFGEWDFDIPLAVPKVKAKLNDSEKFYNALTESLQPKIVVASNGYGEDAIGVMLAKKLRAKFRHSKIFAFPLVGRGDAYVKENFEIKSALSVTPSGGVLKYSVKDLWGDMRAGLLKHVKAQLSDWKKIAGKIRTPICVGDVYLLIHTFFGSGARPLFVATAKTVYLSGHWRLERAIINKFTIKTWTRDSKSAEQLGKNAIYSGSPIMDLLYEDENFNFDDGGENKNIILLLPGSRLRACKDVKLLLDTAEILGEGRIFRMVLAPTLPFEEFFKACKSYGWEKINSDTLIKGKIKISLSYESIAKSAKDVKILIGLGGTANQLCAGLGIPVVSIDEKGKRVQKKLLGDSEILVSADSKSLAEAALKILNDAELYKFMSDSGRERMGKPGTLDDIIKFSCEKFGWDIREKVYREFYGES